MSDDGANAITLIAFVGSVFSPYYAWARRRGGADPRNHCALNVALYGRRGARWTMTERGTQALHRDRDRIVIGPSELHWDATSLLVQVAETAVPIPRPVRGRVRIHPVALPGRTFAIDPAGAHRWSPLAPICRVEVAFDRPELRWSGTGYLDHNEGDAPLERDFARWTWSRAALPDGAAVLYDVEARDAPAVPLALRFLASGAVAPFDPPPLVELAPTRWRMSRITRADGGETCRVHATLEDAPFYARSLVGGRLLGESVVAVHESLSLDRFRTPWVQMMLPFRMPRRSGWRAE